MPCHIEGGFILLGFGKRESTGGIVTPEENRLARETIMTPPAPPAPPTNQAKKLPEMHINIFAFMGNDMERVQKTIKEMEESFEQDYTLYFHVNFNQPRKQVPGNEKRREAGI